MSIITEAQLEKLDVIEKFQLRRKCAENNDIENLLTIAKYNFNSGSAASNVTNLPELCYYYGRLQRGEELKSLLNEKSFLYFMLPDSCKELAKQLFNIGSKFPHLNENEVQFLEDNYCDSKTFELFDIIMFDCILLPRPIKKFDKESLNMDNKNFSKEFLLEIYSCFSENEGLDGSYDKLYVYSRIENKIIQKEYEHLGIGEWCIMQPILSNEFWNLMKENFGEDCANALTKELCYDDDDLEDFRNQNFYLLGADSIEAAASNYFKDSSTVVALKTLVAKFWLEKINSQKINLI